MQKKICLSLVAGLLMVGISGFFVGNAHALRFGDQIAIERFKFGEFFWGTVVTVTPKVELSTRFHDIDLDPAVPQVAVRFTEEGSFSKNDIFNGFRFFDWTEDTEDVDPFENVSIFSTNLVGFDESRLGFNEDNIWLNFEGLGFTTGTYVNLQIGGQSLTSFSNDVTPTPEPGTLLLMGSGILGLAGIGRRRFKHNKQG